MAELLSRRVTLILLLLWGALLHCSGAAADSVCGPTVILSTADADKVRRDCTTINGKLVINRTTEEINLDGLQTITESLLVQGCARDDTECPEQPEPFTISSSTLSTIHGYLGVDHVPGLSNLSLPNLEVVGGVFDLSRPLNLTYVDITNLHTVAGFFISTTPDLKTLRHNGLRDITDNAGWGRRSIYVTQADVDSLDSLFKSPVNTDIYRAGFDRVPNVQELNFGLEGVEKAAFTGNGNLTVTLGGSETTTMELGLLAINGGVKQLVRSSDLKNLTIGLFQLSRDNDAAANGKQLLLPFDNLRRLVVLNDNSTERLELPPQAVDWEDFQLLIDTKNRLNMSSEYSINENGERVRTWYWPKKDIASINISGDIGNDFFKSFLEAPPKVSDQFSIFPLDKENFDCRPFEKLRDEGRLPWNFSCHGISAGNTLSASIPRTLAVILAALLLPAVVLF